MKRKRDTPQQVVRKLQEAQAALAAGRELAAVCQMFGISEQTYYRWKKKYGGMNTDSFGTVKSARDMATAWRLEYNHRCGHGALAYQTPAEYAARCPSAPGSAAPYAAGHRQERRSDGFLITTGPKKRGTPCDVTLS